MAYVVEYTCKPILIVKAPVLGLLGPGVVMHIELRWVSWNSDSFLGSPCCWTQSQSKPRVFAARGCTFFFCAQKKEAPLTVPLPMYSTVESQAFDSFVGNTNQRSDVHCRAITLLLCAQTAKGHRSCLLDSRNPGHKAIH